MRSPFALAAFSAFVGLSFSCTPSGGAPPDATPVATGAAPSATACAPWGGRGFAVTARAQGGHGAQFRELSYDDASGTLAVHDSDLYATGKESPTPRVIQKSITLQATDRETVATQLLGICPDAESMKKRCAPGGCANADITPKGGAKVSVQDHVIVGRVIDRLATFFPELRKN